MNEQHRIPRQSPGPGLHAPASPAPRWQLDAAAARTAFDAYAQAVAAWRLDEANAARLRLEDLGLIVTWQPGRSHAGREAAARDEAAGWPSRGGCRP